jgi:hypothetical protein
VVVDDGVDVVVADAGFVVAGALSGAVGGGLPVAVACLASQIAPAAAVGHVAQLLDVDMQHVAGRGVFVAADRLSGAAVEVGQAVETGPAQDGVHGRRRQTEMGGQRDGPEATLLA